ncbi:MAG: NADH-quinone oxidoreductase subunit [Frankiales bacterium]|jgi:NADH-quinone oxidoreductase subunit J|nr:NADH-quinone oxidoreductase subunit [Frankiales bacterium]
MSPLLLALPQQVGAAPSYGSWHGPEALFGCLGVIAVGSALLVVTARNVVHAALWLVVTLGALAGGYLVLTAELVAWVQVLIYIGAVVVLLLFATMLTRAPIGRTFDLDSDNKLLAAIVGLATAATLVVLVVDAFKSGWVDVQHAPIGTAQADGAAVFRSWVLPFEVVSVLLLAALVGAIVLVRKPDPDEAG